MNKKILMFLVIACIVIAIAGVVYAAGPATSITNKVCGWDIVKCVTPPSKGQMGEATITPQTNTYTNPAFVTQNRFCDQGTAETGLLDCFITGVAPIGTQCFGGDQCGLGGASILSTIGNQWIYLEPFTIFDEHQDSQGLGQDILAARLLSDGSWHATTHSFDGSVENMNILYTANFTNPPSSVKAYPDGRTFAITYDETTPGFGDSLFCQVEIIANSFAGAVCWKISSGGEGPASTAVIYDVDTADLFGISATQLDVTTFGLPGSWSIITGTQGFFGTWSNGAGWPAGSMSGGIVSIDDPADPGNDEDDDDSIGVFVVNGPDTTVLITDGADGFPGLAGTGRKADDHGDSMGGAIAVMDADFVEEDNDIVVFGEYNDMGIPRPYWGRIKNQGLTLFDVDKYDSGQELDPTGLGNIAGFATSTESGLAFDDAFGNVVEINLNSNYNEAEITVNGNTNNDVINGDFDGSLAGLSGQILVLDNPTEPGYTVQATPLTGADTTTMSTMTLTGSTGYTTSAALLSNKQNIAFDPAATADIAALGNNGTYSFSSWTTSNTTGYSVNPNGSIDFTTDKQIEIRTFSPDIEILNFKLEFQALNGSFDTTTGTCDSNCQFDLDDGTCQAEIEKIWAMFPSVNVTMTLSTAQQINMTALNFVCRVFHSSLWPGACVNLSPHGFGALNWMTWVGSSISTVLPSNGGVVINLTGNNIYPNITIPLGTATINNTVQQIGCEVNGTWAIGDIQEFEINKTITIIAN